MSFLKTEQEKVRVVADMIGYNHMNGKNLDTVVVQIIQDTIEKIKEGLTGPENTNVFDDEYLQIRNLAKNHYRKEVLTLLATLKQD